MSKISIIGATGNVGTFSAHTLAGIPYVHQIVLYGRTGRENLLCGITQDLIDSLAASGQAVDLTWTTDLEDTCDSDVVICTAGIPRTPGQDRLDLALENARIVANVAKVIGKCAPDAMILMVTNPVDVMTSVALKYSEMPPNQVFGLGTHLRFNAPEIPYRQAFQGTCKRGTYPYHRGARGLHGAVMVRYYYRRDPDRQPAHLLAASG